ncbi:MAG: hypothetical protein ACM3NT_07755 [Methylocystaceae bacterium]
MSTNFLPAGIINEQLQEICDLAASLAAYESADEQVTVISARIYEITSELVSFINGFTSQPLIFTGMGTTEEVIARLEWLLAFGDEQSEIKLAHTSKAKTKM